MDSISTRVRANSPKFSEKVTVREEEWKEEKEERKEIQDRAV